MISATAVTATLLSSDVISKTISFTVSRIFELGKTIFYTDTYIDISSLEKLEKTLDLLATVRIYDIWIQEVAVHSSRAFQESIISFQQGLDELHQIMVQLNEKIRFHKRKWFLCYRFISFQQEMEDIQFFKHLLDKRFMLIQHIYATITF